MDELGWKDRKINRKIYLYIEGWIQDGWIRGWMGKKTNQKWKHTVMKTCAQKKRKQNNVRNTNEMKQIAEES